MFVALHGRANAKIRNGQTSPQGAKSTLPFVTTRTPVTGNTYPDLIICTRATLSISAPLFNYQKHVKCCSPAWQYTNHKIKQSLSPTCCLDFNTFAKIRERRQNPEKVYLAMGTTSSDLSERCDSIVTLVLGKNRKCLSELVMRET
jgi:hypothetical protein